MPSDLIQSVRPIPVPPAKEKGKRAIKPKVELDPARDEVELRCMDAVRRVRKVYVRHPNYGDLANGLDKFGLDGLEDRVQVSVGKYLFDVLVFKLMDRDSVVPNAGVNY
jgi:DNA ligase-1